VVRRRLVLKRIDPWSVLKFGAVANVVLLAIFLLVAGVVWYIVDRLQLVDQACGIATDVGFTSCGVDAGNLFQALALLGALWTVVQTAVLVFAAFLHNLIADLTGGLTLGVVEEGGARPEPRHPNGSATTGRNQPPDPQRTRSSTSSQTAAQPQMPHASGTFVADRGPTPAANDRPRDGDRTSEQLFGERR
jgi:hypothetical protein